MGGRGTNRKSIASILLAAAIGLSLIGSIVAWVLHPSKRPESAPSVTIGTKDEIYYYHAATPEEAQALGSALVRIGFLANRGTTVLLSKGTAGTVVSFVVGDGGWNHTATVDSFEEIGRRIAPAIGGFPIVVRLIDSGRTLRKELSVGRVAVGARDEVYYLGSATDAEAAALGHALQTAGFFSERGASVELSKNDGAAISFVLDEGAWERPEATAGFERLARQIAASVGGLPIELRLLSPSMEPKRDWTVR